MRCCVWVPLMLQQRVLWRLWSFGLQGLDRDSENVGKNRHNEPDTEECYLEQPNADPKDGILVVVAPKLPGFLGSRGKGRRRAEPQVRTGVGVTRLGQRMSRIVKDIDTPVECSGGCFQDREERERERSQDVRRIHEFLPPKGFMIGYQPLGKMSIVKTKHIGRRVARFNVSRGVTRKYVFVVMGHDHRTRTRAMKSG